MCELAFIDKMIFLVLGLTILVGMLWCIYIFVKAVGNVEEELEGYEQDLKDWRKEQEERQ